VRLENEGLLEKSALTVNQLAIP